MLAVPIEHETNRLDRLVEAVVDILAGQSRHQPAKPGQGFQGPSGQRTEFLAPVEIARGPEHALLGVEELGVRRVDEAEVLEELAARLAQRQGQRNQPIGPVDLLEEPLG